MLRGTKIQCNVRINNKSQPQNIYAYLVSENPEQFPFAYAVQDFAANQIKTIGLKNHHPGGPSLQVPAYFPNGDNGIRVILTNTPTITPANYLDEKVYPRAIVIEDEQLSPHPGVYGYCTGEGADASGCINPKTTFNTSEPFFFWVKFNYPATTGGTVVFTAWSEVSGTIYFPATITRYLKPIPGATWGTAWLCVGPRPAGKLHVWFKLGQSILVHKEVTVV